MRTSPRPPMILNAGIALLVSAPLLLAVEVSEPTPASGGYSPAVVPLEVNQGKVIGLEPMAEMNDEDYQLFKAGEMFLDANYVFADPGGFGTAHGGGGSFGYFWTSMFATQADVMAFNGPTSDVVYSAGAVLRVPIDFAALAFHAYLGGGYQTGHTDEFNFQYGGGLEVRMTEHTGLVLDVRQFQPETAEPTTVFRLGMRILF